jgi:DNA primase
MPLSDYFFNEQSKEINLATLDGKARLAERTRPMLEKIPDGAFRDLMFARLSELTGVGAARSVEAPSPRTASRPRTTASTHKRSLVRTAIALLLQQPALAQAIEPPYLFSALQQPGISLLMELIALCRERPDISAGALLEHFGEREEGAALHKLVLQDLLIPTEQFEHEFTGAIAGLNRQTLKQREDELLARGLSELGTEEKRELLALQRELRARQADP